MSYILKCFRLIDYSVRHFLGIIKRFVKKMFLYHYGFDPKEKLTIDNKLIITRNMSFDTIASPKNTKKEFYAIYIFADEKKPYEIKK